MGRALQKSAGLLDLLEIKADGSYPETGCCASKRIIAGKELSFFQQIQGGQQIDEEIFNGIKIAHANAQTSQRFRANIRAILNLILALLRETKIGAQRPRNLVALLNRSTFESQIARYQNLLASLNLLEM